MVHFRRVPAGRTVSRALALRVRLRTIKTRRDTARTTYELDFMTHLGLTPLEFLVRISKLLALSQPRLREFTQVDTFGQLTFCGLKCVFCATSGARWTIARGRDGNVPNP